MDFSKQPHDSVNTAVGAAALADQNIFTRLLLLSLAERLTRANHLLLKELQKRDQIDGTESTNNDDSSHPNNTLPISIFRDFLVDRMPIIIKSISDFTSTIEKARDQDQIVHNSLYYHAALKVLKQSRSALKFLVATLHTLNNGESANYRGELQRPAIILSQASEIHDALVELLLAQHATHLDWLTFARTDPTPSVLTSPYFNKKPAAINLAFRRPDNNGR